MNYKFNNGNYFIEPINWREANLKLDVNGMEVVKTDYDFDFNNDESVVEYFTKVVNNLWPDQRHFCTRKLMRRPPVKTTRWIHGDLASNFDLLEEKSKELTSRIFPEYKTGDWFRVTGLWINGGPKHTGAPLILSDLQTVDSEVYETATMLQPPLDPSYVPILCPNYNENIVWYSFDDLEPNELLLIRHFKKFDEKHCCFHSGPVYPDKNKPERVSCDGRVVSIEKIKNAS